MSSYTHFLFACGRSIKKALFRKLGKNNPLLLAILIVFSDGPWAPRLPSCWNPVPLTSSSLSFSILFPILFHTSVSFFFKSHLFAYLCTCLEVRGQLAWVPSLLPSCGFWWLNSDYLSQINNRCVLNVGVFFLFCIFISLGITGYSWLDMSAHNNSE